MATELSTSFLCQGWIRPKHLSVRLYPVPSRRLIMMRQSNSGSEQKRPYTKKVFRRKSPKNVSFGPSVAEESDSENSNTDDIPTTNLETMSGKSVETNGAVNAAENKSSTNLETMASNSVETNGAAENTGNSNLGINFNSVEKNGEAENDNSRKLVLSKQNQSMSLNADGGLVNSNVHIQDLIAMIRHAEKNVHLLNQARICALEDLEKILSEKKTLQGEINSLEMRLAETDARIRVASQERLHVELLEDQLEKLQAELSRRGGTLENVHDIIPNDDIIQSLSEEVNLLRTENISLKEDLKVLKAELTDMKGTGEIVLLMEKERTYLESSVKELERKITVSQEDVSKLSTLKSECKSLWERVEHLQSLLDKAAKQADQATLVLQENQVLRNKIEGMEESLEEANVYKISSEKLEEYNVLMQQKIKHLDERLQRSDEEIHSYIQLYQESVNEFQDTLTILREESKKSKLAEPANDMPRKFWSHMLLMIDSWYFEKKIESENASLLREMIWKRDGRIRDAYMECKEKNERETIRTFLGLISSVDRPGLHVVHIAAEMAPVAKVGGLGDVLTGLSKALQQKGHLVEVILPKYDCMQYEHVEDLRGLEMMFESYFEGRMFKNKVWVGTVEGLPVYFIEPHHPGNFFWRGQLYGEHDDFRRFSYFSRAALELLLQLGKRPDIIHCHDWQTSFVAPLYWDIYAPKGLNSARICFTCHNFEYQGTAPASELALCGLDVSHLNRPDRMQDHSAHDRINPLKGAIVYSNIVTTVSPTYAQEVRTAEGGKGLHSTLNSHSKKFVGILNGIDTDTWNPATDIYLKVQYSANDLQGKSDNKEALRRQLGLSSADVWRPLVGCVTRLVPQKGVHLIRHAIYRTLELGGQFVLLGSSPVPHIQKEFEEIANHFQSHEHVRLLLKYDESLSHLIYAASDMLIIPSIFEPCGLTQMIAMKYGSVPVVRKTGGLNDSVFDIDDDSIPVHFRNGYTFFTADEQGFNSALDRAIYHYKNDSDSWQQLVQKNMNIDFSWDSSALQYEELYLKSVARAKAANRS
nr:PREDICTED: probable starch synthase 4, chloroplastic/amyloplastic [Daucus carota subsp. sativus]